VSQQPSMAQGEVAPGDEFAGLTAPYRRELLVHCYRMVGSIQEAEDLVQETYLRAWRAYDRFEGRSSLRGWLYRVATNTCLTALRHRSARVLPSGLAGPSDDPDQPLALAGPGVAWIEPLPDSPASGLAADPADVVATKGSVRLALTSALQQLPARQRAVLILRDVLDWRASEAAELLDTTIPAVNSALQRARARLERVAPREEEVAEAAEPEQRRLVERYATALERAEMDGLLRLMRDDVALEMPPHLTWFSGRDDVARFFDRTILRGEAGLYRLVPITANGQPALAAYRREGDGQYHLHTLQVLTLTPTGVARIVAYLDPTLFVAFDLAPTLEGGPWRR
jgi:RNA polymerase sigma-70 factor, ECF subfamily